MKESGQKLYTTAFPYFSARDIASILRDSKAMLQGKSLLSYGQNVRAFEHSFSTYCGRKFGIACNSCTSALEVVFEYLIAESKLQQGDEIAISTQTFFACASAAINATQKLGCKLVLLDTNNQFLTSLESIKSAYSPRMKALILVHFAGAISSDVFAIRDFCKAQGMFLIEDCSHAHGAIAQDSDGEIYKAGAIGDVGVFSFFSTKILTCGEGGMIVGDDKALMHSVATRVNRRIDPLRQGEHFIAFGHNYRLSEFSAMLGCKQLEQLESSLAHRNKLALAYKRALKPLIDSKILRFQEVAPGFLHSFWRCIVFLDSAYSTKREEIIAQLKHDNIIAEAPYEPLLHKQPLLENAPFVRANCSNAEQLAKTHLSLPMHRKITLKDVAFIASRLTLAIRDLSKERV